MRRVRQALQGIATPRWDRLLVTLWLVGFAIARSARFKERDPYWQVRAGLENLSGQPLARPDSWSWAPVGGDWYQNSPLWDTLLGAGYSVAGFWGLFAVTLATMVGYFLLAERLALRLGGRPLPTLAGLLAVFSATLAMLSPRATLAVQLLILLGVWAALAWADGPAGRLAWPVNLAAILALALGLSTLGNWVHLSFLLIGPGMGVVWLVVWFFAPLRRSVKAALSVAGLVGWGLGPLLSPYGLAAGLERTAAVQRACQGVILEWSTPFTQGMPAELVAMAVIAAVAAVTVVGWLLRRWLRGPRDLAFGGLLALAVIGVPSSLLGLSAVRFLGIGLLTLAPVLAVGVTALVDRVRVRWAHAAASRWWEYTTGRLWRIVLWLTAVVLTPAALLLGANHSLPAEASLVAQLPSGCRLYSDAGLAGPVILLRPDVKVWIDGRADYYGRERTLLQHAYLEGTAPELVPTGTTCVVLDTSLGEIPLVKALDGSSLWRAAGQDGPYRLWLPSGA
ncbi:hypothetical protein ATK74_1313 [Propionicimonas paludicola]|uniref:4-amino-4-deoxy-L-arabinose transferase-like glycosyltransferase n=1 Tax=Propionicimonas paludicola TaxID=185243 RepID=A0A2A9CSZ3_9ACTN|nr:hypothetical protein [Propionicimonas paludicola]PFG16760.1 hypothetical protein ATK74_1313 [Propionicimonas paludicola]